MSLIPAFRAVLKHDVTDEQVAALEKNIRALKGVVSVAFNQNAPKNSCEKYLLVSHMPGQNVEQTVARMDGIQRTQAARF